MKSRKTIMLIAGILTALAAFFQEQTGVSIAMGGAVAAGLVVATYIFGEFKNDVGRLKGGIITDQKWKDPAFWTALVASLLPLASEHLGITLPVEIINTVVAFTLGLIFKQRSDDVAKNSNYSRRLN